LRASVSLAVWAVIVGPYSNRQETYAYFSLPFCRGPKESIGHYHETMGESLLGVELDFSGLDIKFRTNTKKTVFCKMKLTNEAYQTFVYAIKNSYFYQMYLDDMPIWGMVGEVDETRSPPAYKLYTHKLLDIGFNDKQVVDVNLTSGGHTEIHPGVELEFSYEVKWVASPIKFADRFDKYLDPSFFQHRIHWFSIFNSFMMVVFLVGLVWMILVRTLRKDYARYQKEDSMDDLDADLGDEYGWKQVHGDVFRAPSMPLLFASCIGAGYHVFTVAVITIVLAIVGEFYTERGSLLSAAIFVYAASSPVNGYAGGSMYARFGGRHWIRQMALGAFLLPSLVCGVAFLINFIAIYYHASRAIPFTVMLAVTAICLFVILPLTLVGTVLGRNMSGQGDYPCSPIGDFRYVRLRDLASNWLSDACIFRYFIFTSFWAYKIYYVYGFMLLVTIILAIVTVCVTIVCSYFLLNAEDYRWRWTSFMAGASTALYVYLYSVYYFFFKTKMYGLFQTVFYFGYMGIFSAALGLMTGTIGYVGTAKFVRKIYSTVKID
uniref:Transmembrane 9 superfamily member n=1 Tax=Heligmosomoides polygyrus TaxID=6339 RepID=A0A8L8JDQ5_HELPZ